MHPEHLPAKIFLAHWGIKAHVPSQSILGHQWRALLAFINSKNCCPCCRSILTSSFPGSDTLLPSSFFRQKGSTSLFIGKCQILRTLPCFACYCNSMGPAYISARVYMGLRGYAPFWKKNLKCSWVVLLVFSLFCVVGAGEGGGRNIWLFPSTLDDRSTTALSSSMCFH